MFCGAGPATREHVVSKMFLDDPLPDHLPLVHSCQSCNNGFSRDEEYLGCLIDCVVSGSTDPEAVGRYKVRASLRHSPALAARIAAGRVEAGNGQLVWKPEEERVRSIALKLARGHAAHQYSEPRLDDPEGVTVVPLATMTLEQRHWFETIPESPGWPEIGSRAFVNILVADGNAFSDENGWTILQPGRYRYAVAQPGETIVRGVLSEYLAFEVVW